MMKAGETRETEFFPSDRCGRQDLASGAQPRRSLAVWVALSFVLVWVFFTHSHVGSFNDRSRMAAIESRVVRGTWIIDESNFSRTVDRIYVDGHFYSDKPPVLTSIASGVYTVLYKGLHLSLDAGWCDFDEGPCHCRAFCDDDPDWAYYLLTLTLVGLPSALMLALFYHMTGFFGLGNPAALLLTGTLGLATQVFAYSTVFNSHIPAAACLLAGFYALLRARPAPPGAYSPRAGDSGGDEASARCWLFASGLFTALAFAFDLGAGLFFAAFFGHAAWDTLTKVRLSTHGERMPTIRAFAEMVEHLPWSYLLGGLLPIAWMAILDYQVVGNPLPPYMYTPGYDYPGSRFPQTIAGNRSPENVLIYGLRLLFGDHGLFAFNPVLLWAVAALVQVCSKKPGFSEKTRFLGRAAALVGLTSSLFVLYFILFTDNFGGAAYGPRWYTVFIPLFFFFVAAKWENQILKKARKKPGLWSRRLLFLALACLSFINGYQGALAPWRTTTPLLRLEHAPPEQRDPVDMALSGVTFEEIEPDLLATFATRRVDKRWFDARSGLVIPPGPMWLFVGPGTPLDPALAERTGLPSGLPTPYSGGLACHVDLRPAWDTYLEQLVTSAWISPVLVPPDSDPSQRVPVSLPAGFGGQFTLLGYELLGDEPRTPAPALQAGAEVALITAWRVEGRPESPLAIFIHLLDSQGRIGGQFDGLGADPYSLRPGDVMLHVHRFAIVADVPPGRHWLQLGLYNPETMVRLPLTDQETDRLLLTQIEVAGQ